MSVGRARTRVRRIDRREFFGLGAKAAAALAALPAAGPLLAGCGSGDERAEPAAPAPSPPVPPAEPAPPPRAEAPSTPAPADAEGALVTEVASAAAMVKALQYVNQSPKADQNCASCQLFTAASGGRGRCQLFPQGLVKESGWCASWAARVS